MLETVKRIIRLLLMNFDGQLSKCAVRGNCRRDFAAIQFPHFDAGHLEMTSVFTVPEVQNLDSKTV